MRKNHKFAGFTLIELLVTIVIIGVLATISVSTFNGYFEKARDAQRVSDIAQIKKRLELYYVEHEVYPAEGWAMSYNSVTWAALESYLGKLPKDPLNTGGASYGGGFTYGYYAHPTSADYCKGQAYMIVWNKESGDEDSDGVTFCSPSFPFHNYANTVTEGVNHVR